MKIYNVDGRKNICGKKIKEARTRIGMSQTELAAKMQTQGIVLERDSISRIERGRRLVTDYELKGFASILNVELAWLLECSINL